MKIKLISFLLALMMLPTTACAAGLFDGLLPESTPSAVREAEIKKSSPKRKTAAPAKKPEYAPEPKKEPEPAPKPKAKEPEPVPKPKSEFRVEREECSMCGGLKTCSRCFGEGSFHCTDCIGGRCIACDNGKVLVGFDSRGNRRYRNCSYCTNGRCRKCRGKGWIDCTSCVDGKCPSCHGTGYR